MQNKKRGFVLYFDACEGLNCLEPEQRGWVLTALNAFAMACAQDVETGAERILSQYPQLSPEARRACGALCDTVRRDTWRWNEKQAGSAGLWSGRQNRGTPKEDELAKYVRRMHQDRARQERNRDDAPNGTE